MRVSIIVPIYNTEKYLNRCINSLLNQSYTDIEIWLIDDGSIDRSGEICDTYAGFDNRVHVIHKPNGGEASARNAGLINATGDYVMFCDSDDEYLLNAVEVLINAIKHEDTDLVFGAYLETTDSITRIAVANRQNYNIATLVAEILTDTCPYSTLYILSTVNGKLFKNNILKDNNLIFNENWRIGNDTLFMVDYLSLCKNVYNIFAPIYTYYKYNTDDRLQGMAWTYPDYFLFKIESNKKLLKLIKENCIFNDNKIKIYQKFIDELIRLLVIATVYENYFEHRFTILLGDVIKSDLVFEAIKYYKCTRISDSELIPRYIMDNNIAGLLNELRVRAHSYVTSNGKSQNVRMIYSDT